MVTGLQSLSKGVGMIRAEIGLKNCCFLILYDLYPNYYFGNHFPYLHVRWRHTSQWKSIVSWKYMKSNKKCVFNVNFQYNHKHVPTAYFSMMFNIHKHISHLIFVLVPECGEYEICNQKIILRSISRQRPFFIDRFHP
jgi:hypothetical protein